MTATTYTEATTPKTPAEAAAEALASCVTEGCTVAGWGDTAPQRAMIENQGEAIAFESGLRVQLALAITLEGAATVDDSWVDVGLKWYQIERIPAIVSEWQIPLSVAPGNAPLTITNASTIVLQSSDGTYFVSAQVLPITLNAGTGYKGTVRFVARAAGTLGNQIPGAISRVTQGPAGLSVDATGTQVLTVAGRDAETNTSATERAYGRWGTLAGMLTAAGWSYVLRTPEVGGVATITRVFVDDANPDGPGSTRLYCANSSGPATAAEVAALQVQANAYEVSGTGRNTVHAAANATTAITVQLLTDGSNSLASAQAATALTQLAGAVTGNVLYLDAVIKTLMSVRGVINLPGLSLTADIVRPANGVIVLVPTVTQL